MSAKEGGRGIGVEGEEEWVKDGIEGGRVKVKDQEWAPVSRWSAGTPAAGT